MKITESLKNIRAMKEDALKKELRTKRSEFELSMLKVKAGKETNNAIVKKLKHEIARINTIIREKVGE